MPSVDTQSVTPSARVNSVSSTTTAGMSPTADASAPSLNAGSGSPGTGNLFMSPGLGGQGPQLTCKCLNIAPFDLCYFATEPAPPD